MKTNLKKWWQVPGVRVRSRQGGVTFHKPGVSAVLESRKQIKLDDVVYSVVRILRRNWSKGIADL